MSETAAIGLTGAGIAEDEVIRKEAAKRGLTETEYRMRLACPDSLMKDILQDNRHPRGPSSIVPSGPTVQTKKPGTGWSKEIPLVQPYVSHIDRIAESFAAEERAKRLKELRELKGEGPEAA